MTTLNDKFREAAQKTVRKFSIGDYIVEAGVEKVYDTDTGSYTVTSSQVTVPMAKVDIHDSDTSNAAYPSGSFVLVAAGLDLGSVDPSIGDKITTPDGEVVRIVDKKFDQYKAKYSFVVV